MISDATANVYRKVVCCYARVRDKTFFETHDFYRVDIQLMQQLGYEVVVTNSVLKMLRTRCDIYYAWWFGYGVSAAILGLIRGKPVIVSGVLHTLACRGLSGWPTIKRSVMKLTMKIANCSIVCSKGEYDRLEGFQPRWCKIVPLCINSSEYFFQPMAREKFILIVTQLSVENVKRKMVLAAVAAFAKFNMCHPEFKLVICGAIGEGIDAVRSCVRSYNLDDQVMFTGRVSLKDKIALLQNAWAYLQPTSCEGFGLAIGEALSCGTPVVTSPEACVVGTYGDAVYYGNTPEELAKGLSGLVENTSLYQAMQSLGLNKVATYSLENRRSHFNAILEHVCQ